MKKTLTQLPTLVTMALLSLAVFSLNSCMSKLDVVMWYTVYGDQPMYVEPTKKVPARIVATCPGATHRHFSDVFGHMGTSFSTFCKVRTEDGSTYKADLMPCVLYGYFAVGDKGIAEIGLESDALHAFVPERDAAKVEENPERSRKRKTASAGNASK